MKYFLEDEWNVKATDNAMYYIHAGNSAWEDDDFFKTGQEDIRELTRHPQFKDVDTTKVLDFGCGIGRLSFALAPLFKNVTGTDVSQVMIDKANDWKVKKEIKNVDFIKCHGANLNVFQNNTFSFIYSNIVLQHIENPLRGEMRKELVRVLKPGCWMNFQDECFEVYTKGYTDDLYKLGLRDVCVTRINKESVWVWAKKK